MILELINQNLEMLLDNMNYVIFNQFLIFTVLYEDIFEKLHKYVK